MFDQEPDIPNQLSDVRRAISSVVGVTLILVIVVLLASVTAGIFLTYSDELEEPDFLENGSESNSSAPLNPWSEEDALLAPEDPTAGAEDVRYRIVFDIQESDSDIEGDSLNELQVSVDGVGEDMFSGVTKSDIEQFEVNRTDGSVINIEDDIQSGDNWDIQEGGSEIEIVLDGDTYENPSVGDEIVVIFGSVDNPNAPGTYDITVTLNQDPAEQSGTLEIIEG